VKGDILYRVYGGSSSVDGNWASFSAPLNQIDAIRYSALPPVNTATSISKITLTGAVDVEVSTAAKLFGQPGGIQQVQLPCGSPNILRLPGTPLDPGFFPIVPSIFLLDLSNGD
jgi:hypothetical protein